MSNGTKNDWRLILKHPSAFLPVLLLLFALAVVVVAVARLGVAREADEGAAAHLWQWSMAAQLPIIGIFLVKWLRRAPRAASVVLGLQIAAAGVAVAPVYFLHL